MNTKSKEQVRPSTSSDQNNEFLDDFLKPPQPSEPIPERRDKSPISIQNRKKQKNKKGEMNDVQQSQLNKQIKTILQSIKREQILRRQRTKQYLQKLAEQKEFQRKKHQFQIAERRIKKRMMLIQRKQQLNQQLLCLASSTPTHQILKEKSKSVEDFVGATPLNNLNSSSNQDLLHSSKNLKAESKRKKMKTDILIHASSSSIIEEKSKQKEPLLPELNKRKAIMMKNKERQKKIPTITFTRQLIVEMEDESLHTRKKYKNYLSQVSSQLKRRNYTNPSSQLSRIYNEGEHSKSKTQKAIQLIKKIDTKHRNRLKNYEQQDYAQAQRKIQLLNFLFKGPS